MDPRINRPPSGADNKLGANTQQKAHAETKLRLARLKLDDDHDQVLDAIVKGKLLDQALQTYRKNMVATDQMLRWYQQGDYGRVCEIARGWV